MSTSPDDSALSRGNRRTPPSLESGGSASEVIPQTLEAKSAQPPATAGRMVISDPSDTAVSKPSW